MSSPATQSRTESITVLRSEAANGGTASTIESANASPPTGTTERTKRARLRNVMPNRSPTRCSKLVGHLHLPSTFRAPSEFRSLPWRSRRARSTLLGGGSDRIQAEPPSLGSPRVPVPATSRRSVWYEVDL